MGILTVINTTVGSSLPSGAVLFLQEYFGFQGREQLVLPNSIYLVGYVLGPLVFGPLSETYGRRSTMIITFLTFTAFTLGCALAPTWAGLIVFRLLVGISGSSPISVVGGIYADIYNDPVTRGRAMALFMASTTLGPIVGPIISGFISVITWRWTFWVALILAGVTWIPLIFLPETYGPVILKWRAQKLRKETGNPDIYSPIELERKGIKEMMTVVLTRPIRMFVFEMIVLTVCLYLALIYAVFYIFFQAYPVIFGGIYGFNPGEQGLAFIPIVVGAAISLSIYIAWDYYLQRAKDMGKPWANSEEYRRLPLACLGGPLFVVALFWIGWTARADIHWIVPILSGIPFGVGFLLIFMALLNYLVDAYEIFAASAFAAASCTRSIFGAILPFAGRPMYINLGVGWACSLLGFLSALMCVIPFAFIKYGPVIREKSKFCQYLKEKKRSTQEEEEKENERSTERIRSQSGQKDDPGEKV